MSEAAWLLEALLTVLLALSLFHALRLERALTTLRRDRARLEALLEGFNESTRMAEEGIERLRLASEGAGRHITRQIERAAVLREDLSFLCERADRSADSLEHGLRERRALANERGRQEAEPCSAEARMGARGGIAPHPAQRALSPGSAGSSSNRDASPGAASCDPERGSPLDGGRREPPYDAPRVGSSYDAPRSVAAHGTAATLAASSGTTRAEAPSSDAVLGGAPFASAHAPAASSRVRPAAALPAGGESLVPAPGEPRVRSKAERDLLRALQLGR